MIEDDIELMKRINAMTAGYKGSGDDLVAALGCFIVAYRFGWRVARITCTKRAWRVAVKEFGDLKELFHEETELSHKSLGLALCKAMNKYWEVVRCQVVIPKAEKTAFVA